jgi:hypothetical protein
VPLQSGMKTEESSLAIENVKCFTRGCHRFCVLVPEAISIKTVVPASEIPTSSPSGLGNAFAIKTDYENHESLTCY